MIEGGPIGVALQNGSPTTIACTLLAALDIQPVNVSANLPTWDLAAAELAQVYLDAVGVTPTLRR